MFYQHWLATLNAPTKSRARGVLSMLLGVVAQMTALAERGEILIAAVHLVVDVTGAAVGVWRAQVRDGEHDLAACDRVRLIVDGPAPLAFPAGALADTVADGLPVGRVA